MEEIYIVPKKVEQINDHLLIDAGPRIYAGEHYYLQHCQIIRELTVTTLPEKCGVWTRVMFTLPFLHFNYND